jgi:class 3 adenylate cyclase
MRVWPSGARPIDTMQSALVLDPRRGGGTRLTYEVRARPRTLFGRIAIPVAIGLVSRRRFASVFRSYDASSHAHRELPRTPVRLAPGAVARVERARRTLLEAGLDERGVTGLCALVGEGDTLDVARLRPYHLADRWGLERREALELCLHATRAGLLELRWELLCPLCRGPSSVERSLDHVTDEIHCETCLIDFTADFARSVEVTFRPSAAVREVETVDFCVAGPQVTPSVVAQQLLRPAETRSLDLRLEPGSYRARSLGVPGAVRVTVGPGGRSRTAVRAAPTGWNPERLELAGDAMLQVENGTAGEQLVVLERTEWSDRAATAAEVTALQVFRDLFAAEALRPGEPISVGTLAVVFTDLKDSTRYYRDVGDAPAFGSVLEHLDVLRNAVRAEGGAVVKAMGDAIMAVFPRPVSAVRAMQAAQRAVDGRPLALKVGIHYGPCIAINQNGVLDYFGSAVNLAARLVGVSSGNDVVISDAVLADPEVRALSLPAELVDVPLKGFEDAPPAIWRLTAYASPARARATSRVETTPTGRPE